MKHRPTLTEKQTAALNIIHAMGKASSFDFGSSTVAALKRVGFIETVKGEGKVQLTDRGREWFLPDHPDEIRKPKRGPLHRDNFSSLLQWESAVSAVYGGVTSQWPKWAKDVLRREQGYV
jgi:hypothetical protein